ncbi:MAG: M20/M25/M40 family metallo-hydrolase, partial [Candidatus Latescibacteria bacterium]|nr:M20/M25/M40 family metallo-hydrolase [Candidatus Latescibacterota bacterium]
RLQQRRGPVRLRLVLDSRIEPKESWNVVGELTGAEHPQDILVCGGHYDTWHVGPGAIDNAAGVVAVVEAARALAVHREHLRRTVRFVAFGVEESGLVGSWAYTQRHAGELDDTWLMINNDVGGRPSGLGIAGAEDLLPVLEGVASRVRVDGLEKPFGASCGTTSWGSDHFPFFAHGVPTVGLGTESVWPEDRFYGHSRADTADKVYPQGLSECAAINARVLFEVANLNERPRSWRRPLPVRRWRRLSSCSTCGRRSGCWRGISRRDEAADQPKSRLKSAGSRPLSSASPRRLIKTSSGMTMPSASACSRLFHSISPGRKMVPPLAGEALLISLHMTSMRAWNSSSGIIAPTSMATKA